MNYHLNIESQYFIISMSTIFDNNDNDNENSSHNHSHSHGHNNINYLENPKYHS